MTPHEKLQFVNLKFNKEQYTHPTTKKQEPTQINTAKHQNQNTIKIKQKTNNIVMI